MININVDNITERKKGKYKSVWMQVRLCRSVVYRLQIKILMINSSFGLQAAVCKESTVGRWIGL